MMPAEKEALLRRVHEVLTPNYRFVFTHPSDGFCVKAPPLGLRGGRSEAEWERMTPAERAAVLDVEAPLGSDPVVLFRRAWAAAEQLRAEKPAPLPDAEELARLTDPAVRRRVIRDKAPAPQPFYRGGVPRKVWKALSKSQRRAVLDQTAPMPAPEDPEVLP